MISSDEASCASVIAQRPAAARPLHVFVAAKYGSGNDRYSGHKGYSTYLSAPGRVVTHDAAIAAGAPTDHPVARQLAIRRARKPFLRDAYGNAAALRASM